MNTYSITRTLFDPDGTFGSLKDSAGKQLCLTVELPWEDNHPRISCIPTGTYTVQKYMSPKHGHVWQIMNVPDRSNIEIHNANLASQLLGCVGVGSKMGELDGLPAILDSQKTLNMLRIILPDTFSLTIS